MGDTVRGERNGQSNSGYQLTDKGVDSNMVELKVVLNPSQFNQAFANLLRMRLGHSNGHEPKFYWTAAPYIL
jgi:hypothetical protein